MDSQRSPRTGRTPYLPLVILVGLALMGFSLAAALLAQPAVALVAGTASVAVCRSLTRHLLR